MTGPPAGVLREHADRVPIVGAEPSGTRPDPAGTLPRDLARRYAAGALLGTGATADVVRARDLHLQRDVAIKLFPAPGTAPSVQQGQLHEGRLLAALNHRALTTVFDVGTDTSRLEAPRVYVVMEYVPGLDLRQRLLDGPLAPLQVCLLGEDLCDAIDYLHGTGLLHRDIKPANVLLADRRADVRIRGKLTDFGLASPATTPHASGTAMGTAAYIAPEQAVDLPATSASDVYALGLVLLEALTATRAYPGGQEEAARERLLRQPLVPDHVSAPLAVLLQRMTARDPDGRPAAREAADGFRGLAADRLAGRGT